MQIELSKEGATREQIQDIISARLLDPLFAAIFYTLSSLNQLHRLGYIDKYTTVPEHSEVLFLMLKDAGYVLTDEEVRDILSLSSTWDAAMQEKLLKFYKAYHALRWDKYGKQCN